eukprot:749015-Hanusia_phi.AAC.3
MVHLWLRLDATRWIELCAASGVIKVWSLDNPEHVIKFEAQCLGGAIHDIQWSPDSQRIVAVGDGQLSSYPADPGVSDTEMQQARIRLDASSCGILAAGLMLQNAQTSILIRTSSSVGEIAGHSKKILSCDFKPVKPFQIATASEDFQVLTKTYELSWFNLARPLVFGDDECLRKHVGKKLQIVKLTLHDSGHTARWTSVQVFQDPQGHFNTSMQWQLLLTERLLTYTGSHQVRQLCTVGSDMLGFIYDCASNSKIGSSTPSTFLNEVYRPAGELKGHKGTLYACSWSSDSSKLVTASADKTVIVWDANTFANIGTWSIGGAKPATEDMQVGVAWVPNSNQIISLSLRGDLTYLDASSAGKIVRVNPAAVIKGHNKNITALTTDPKKSVIVSASYDGLVNKFAMGQAEGQSLQGKWHTNAIADHAICGDVLVSCGLDDTFRTADLSKMEVVGEGLSLGGQPTGLSVSSDGQLCVIATNKALLCVRKQVESSPPPPNAPDTTQGASWKIASTTPISFGASGISLSPAQNEADYHCCLISEVNS